MSATLPPNGSAWPPVEHQNRYREMALNRAWLEGNVDKLTAAHGGGSTPRATVQRGGGIIARAAGAIGSAFWATGAVDDDVARYHVPIAEDVARTKAQLMAGERLRITVEGPVWEVDSQETVPDPDGAEGATVPRYRAGDPLPETEREQKRLEEILAANRFDAACLAGFEVGSALGSFGFRLATDPDVFPDMPIIARANATGMIPSYSWSHLTSVIFWREVRRASTMEVWRHLELHPLDGRVIHGLYVGTESDLGKLRPLADHPSTAFLAELVDEQSAITLVKNPEGRKIRTAVSIPNALPDPSDLESAVGRSDYTPAARGLYSIVDKFASDLMQSVDDGKSRLAIADYLLNNLGTGAGRGFDRDQRLIRQVKMPAPDEVTTNGLPIQQVEFDLKVEEYLLGIERFRDMAIEASGYNPQTMGDSGDVQQTATEYSGKNKRSLATRDGSIPYARPELSGILTALLALDVQMNGGGRKAYPVRVEFPESVQPTAMESITVAKALQDSGGTIEEVVRATYPDLDERTIQHLVAKREAQAQPVDPVTFGLGGQGVGEGDGI